MVYKAAGRLKDAKRAEERRQKKKIQYFRGLLRSSPLMKEGVTWEELRKEVANHGDFEAIETEEHRVALFTELVAELKERGFKSEDDDDDKRRSGKKKKHRSRKHDRSSGSESEGDKSKRHRGEGRSRSRSRSKSSGESD